MKGWKVLLAILVGALFFFGVAALIMPSRYLAARALTIRSEPQLIFDTVTDLRTWPSWTIWNEERDPSIRFTHAGPEGQVGASLAWQSEVFGRTRHVIAELEPPREVTFTLHMGSDLPPAKARVTLEPLPADEGGGTRVIWGMTGDVGANLVARLKVGVIQRSAARDFEQNLFRLKRRIELQLGVLVELPDGGFEYVDRDAGRLPD